MNKKFKMDKKWRIPITVLAVCMIVILAVVLRPQPSVWGVPYLEASCNHMDNGVRLIWLDVKIMSMNSGLDEEKNKEVLLALDSACILLYNDINSQPSLNKTFEEIEKPYMGVQFNDSDSSRTLSIGDTLFIPLSLWNSTKDIRVGIQYPDGYFLSIPT